FILSSLQTVCPHISTLYTNTRPWPHHQFSPSLLRCASQSRFHLLKKSNKVPHHRMPPKKVATGEGADAPIGLTDNELRFIKAIFDNMTQKPDADWTQVANDLGLKDAKCAKERFRQMSNRHGWRDQGSAVTTSPRKPRSAATGPSVNGKIKKTRSPRKKIIKSESLVEEEEEEVKDEVKNDPDETETET
ncbi:Uncharacterized protein TCAP_01248, partial [Tolypocladium capitatum]